MRLPSSRIRAALFVVALAVVACSIRARRAAADDVHDTKNPAIQVEISQVDIGFDGRFKVGYWTPIRMVVVNHGEAFQGSLQLETVDGDAVSTRYYNTESSQLKLSSNESTEVTLYARFGRVTSAFQVELRGESDQLLVQRTVRLDDSKRPASSTSQLIVTLGGDIGVAEALSVDGSGGPERGEVVLASVATDAELPTHWLGYESVDTLIVATRNQTFHAQRLQAIETWIRLGGRMILCIGQDGDRLLAEPGPLSKLLPGRYVETVPVSSSAELETYVRATSPLNLRQRDVTMPVFENVQGLVEVSVGAGSQARPLIVRRTHGLGHILLVAIDLDLPVLAAWPDRPRLVADLLSQASGRQRRESREFRGGRALHVGYQDMAGQLRAALDQFAGVRPLAFSAIAAMVFIYILLIGPGDYFLLKKLAGRMEWTWLTFSLLTAGFCVLVVVLVRATQSDQTRVNYVEVVDLDVQTGTMRGTAWAHLYSPARGFYDLRIDPRVPHKGAERDVLLSWNGLPGRGLNAMDTPVTMLTPDYHYTSRQTSTDGGLQNRLTRVPVQQSSSKTLQARWWGSLSDLPASQLRQEARDGVLRGEFTNPLDVTLSECIILFGSWAYRLDRPLAPAETVAIQEEMVEKTVAGFLNDRRIVENQDVATPWDETSADIPRILKVMLFYRLAGGAKYTNLSLAYQNFVDLSDHVQAGHAVLFARTARSFGDVKIDGAADADRPETRRSWTFVRIVLPVMRQP